MAITLNPSGLLRGVVAPAPQRLQPIFVTQGRGDRGESLEGAVLVASPLPDSILLREVAMPKRLPMVAVPGAAVGVARESNRDSITLSYGGILFAESPEELRETVDTIYAWLLSEDGVSISIWPGRSILAYLMDNARDLKYPGVADRVFEMTFSLLAPNPVFADDDGDEFFIP